MDEQHLNENLFNGGEPPVPIPSVDRAWGGMEKLLNKELPVIYKTPTNYGRWLSIKAATVVIVTFMAMPVLLPEKGKKVGHPHPVANSVFTDTANELAITPSDSQRVTIHNDPLQQSSATANDQPLSADNKDKQQPSAGRQLTLAPDPHKVRSDIPENKRSSSAAGDQSLPGNNQLALAPDPHKVRSDIHKNKRSSSAAGNDRSLPGNNQLALARGTHKVRPSIHKNKRSSSSENNFDTAHQDVADKHQHYQQSTGYFDPSTFKNNEQKPSGIDLATLPLHIGKWKALTHHNMQVSLPSIADKKDKLDRWSLWLQLNIPVNSSPYYFTGPKGNDAFYRNLIPSLRLQKAIGRSALSIELHPYNAALLPRKLAQRPDTGYITNKDVMIKQFGPEMTLQYHYPVYKKLYVSAGVGASWWRRAIIEKGDSSRPVRTITVIADDKHWKGYTRFAFTANIELYYDLPKWQIALRTALPLNKYTDAPKYFPKKPLQVELLLRRRIIKW